MDPLFVGSHPAIDFLNTAFAPNGERVETIGDGKAHLDWLVAAGLVDEARASKLIRRSGVKALDTAATEARKIREWARDWLDAWRAEPRKDYGEEIAVLNRLLARGARTSEVVAGKDGLEVIEVPHVETPDALIALVAAQIAALITQEEPSLVKACASSACTLWFLDRTKAHRRLFCSPATCGNRAKVAAYRERQRS